MRSNLKKSRKKKKKERWNWDDQSKAVMTPMTERITFKQFLEGYRGRSEEYPFPIEVPVDPTDEDSDLKEVEGYIVYNWETPSPATRHQPAEGGVEVEYLVINGNKIYSDQDLERLGIDASFEGIIDQYIDRIYQDKYEEQQGYY